MKMLGEESERIAAAVAACKRLQNVSSMEIFK